MLKEHNYTNPLHCVEYCVEHRIYQLAMHSVAQNTFGWMHNVEAHGYAGGAVSPGARAHAQVG